MKKLFLLTLSIGVLGILVAQPPQKVNSNYQFKAAGADSAIRLPLRHASNPDFRAPGMVWYNDALNSLFWSQTGATNDSSTFNGNPGAPVTSIQTNFGGVFHGFAQLTYDSVHHVLITDSLHNRFQTFTPDSDFAFRQHYANVTGPGFWTTMEEDFNDNPDGKADNVLGYGCYNLAADGVRVDNHYPGMGWFQESHFQASGSKQTELHYDFVDSSGRNTRIYTQATNELNGGGFGIWTIDQYGWKSHNTSDAGYFNIDDQGQDNFRSHSLSVSILDTVPTWGSLTIHTLDNGVVLLDNGTSAAVPILDIHPDLVLEGSVDGTPINVHMSNVNGSGVLSADGVISTGSAFGDVFLIDAVNGLFSRYENVSAVSGNSVSELGVASSSDAYHIYRRDFGGGVHNDFNTGQHTVDSSYRVAYSDAGGLTAGVQIVVSGSTNNVSIGDTRPDPNAKLDVQSTTQGFLPPRMTSSQRDAMGPVQEGMHIYNLTLHLAQYWNGIIWKSY